MWKLPQTDRAKAHDPGVKSQGRDGGAMLKKHIHAGR